MLRAGCHQVAFLQFFTSDGARFHLFDATLYNFLIWNPANARELNVSHHLSVLSLDSRTLQPHIDRPYPFRRERPLVCAVLDALRMVTP